MKTILILASDVKGKRLMEECKALGCKVLVLTRESLKNAEGWPDGIVDEFFYMPTLTKKEDVINAVSYLNRTIPLDLILPMDEFDTEVAAALREHLRIPGMGETTTRYFRDKLAMRMAANENGILAPAFVPVFRYDAINEFMSKISPPWVLKPRSQGGSAGIRKVHHADELWHHLELLGDEQSHFVLEQFVPGDIYHVDALTNNEKVVFVEVSRYGRPPLDIIQNGGIFMTSLLNRKSREATDLIELNNKLLSSFKLKRGVTHTEFIRSYADGKYYFLETAARVAGANIPEVIEFATGLNIWAEWAKIEVLGEQYKLPKLRHHYAGIMLCLAKQEWPDTSAYNDPEVVWRMHKKQHAGLIVASPDVAKVQVLLQNYSLRFSRDFLSVAPQYDKIDR
jgi:biotin carboxylase